MQIKEKHFRLELVMETIMVHMWTKGHGKIVSVSFPVTVVLFFQLERKNIGMENTTLLLLGWIVFFLIYVIFITRTYLFHFLFIHSFIILSGLFKTQWEYVHFVIQMKSSTSIMKDWHIYIYILQWTECDFVLAYSPFQKTL